MTRAAFAAAAPWWRLACTGCALAWLLACGNQGADRRVAAPAEDLPAIDHPGLDGVEPAVRRQLQAQRRALEALQRSADADPEALAKAYGEMGRLYHVYDLREPAQSCYTAAELLAPQSPRWPYLAGILHQERGALEPSVASFQRALALDPQNAAAAHRLGDVLLDLQRLDEARRAFTQARAAGPEMAPAARFGLGRVALADGAFEAAVVELEAVRAALPEAGKVRYPLAMAMRQLGRTEEARQLLELPGHGEVGFPDPEAEALSALAAGAGAAMQRGGRALMARRPEEAEAAFQRALDLDPGYLEARRNLSLAQLRQGKAREAAETLREALRNHDDDAMLHFDLGNALLAGGDAVVAARHFARAAELAPDFAAARFNLANTLILLGRWAEARRHLELVVADDPGHYDARYLLAMEPAQRGAAATAELELRRLLAEKPDHGPAREGLGQLLLARGRLEEAAAELVSVDPPTTQSVVRGSVALSQLGRHAEARELLESGLTRSPGDRSLALALARLLATCPELSLRDGRRALQLAEALYRQQPDALAAETVGLALAAAGELARAVEWHRSLLAGARDAGQTELASRLEADLRLFEQGRAAYRPLS